MQNPQKKVVINEVPFISIMQMRLISAVMNMQILQLCSNCQCVLGSGQNIKSQTRAQELWGAESFQDLSGRRGKPS